MLSLNWISLQRAARAPDSVVFGQRLSKVQWEMVRNLERLMSGWMRAEAVSAEALGRTAAKAEGLENALSSLRDSFEIPGVSSGVAESLACASFQLPSLFRTYFGDTVPRAFLQPGVQRASGVKLWASLQDPPA